MAFMTDKWLNKNKHTFLQSEIGKLHKQIY